MSESQSQHLNNVYMLQAFWDRVDEMMVLHPLEYGGHYELTIHGELWKSYQAEYGITWIRWEPYSVVNHFSHFDDPNGRMSYVKD